MVEVLPPAPAALVLEGRALAIFSFWSAAARRRMAVLAPPGGVGDTGRPIWAPVAGALTGDDARGEDCSHFSGQRAVLFPHLAGEAGAHGCSCGSSGGRSIGLMCVVAGSISPIVRPAQHELDVSHIVRTIVM